MRSSPTWSRNIDPAVNKQRIRSAPRRILQMEVGNTLGVALRMRQGLVQQKRPYRTL